MPTIKSHSGWYVTARMSPDGGPSRTAWLLGPFTTHNAAMHMVDVAARAANRTDDPRFAFAAFGWTKLTAPIGKPLPPGRLDLKFMELDDIIYASIIDNHRIVR